MAKSNWPLLAIAAGVVVVAVAVPLYFGEGWEFVQGLALVIFSAALAVATLALAVGTDTLARANVTLAQHQERAEIREGLDAAKKFIEIGPGDFVDVVRNVPIPHPFFDAIDKLAAYSNVLQDPITVRDVYQVAAKMDDVRIANTRITADQANDIAENMLRKLQQRIAAEIPNLRLKIRNWTKEVS